MPFQYEAGNVFRLAKSSLWHFILTRNLMKPMQVKIAHRTPDRTLIPYNWKILSPSSILLDGMGMCCEKKTLTGWRNVRNTRWRAPDQEVDQRGHGKRLCKEIAKHVIWTRRMLWIMVDGRSWWRLDDDQDGGWVSVSSSTGSPG